MPKKPKDWIEFGLILIGMILIVIVTAGLLNFTGDCAPDVARCGQTPRKISLLVLAFGGIAIGYFIHRFARRSR